MSTTLAALFYTQWSVYEDSNIRKNEPFETTTKKIFDMTQQEYNTCS